MRAVRPDGRVITLRPLRRSDRAAWEALREANADWLQPWESTLPRGPEPPMSFQRMRRGFERAAREGRVLPFAIDVDGRLVGQMHLFEMVWGSRWTASAGYWLEERATGQGIATWALAMLIDHGIRDVGLHRIEVSIRPENAASLAVARRLGLRDEGLRPGLMHVGGAWRDHVTFAVTAEELEPEGLTARLGSGPTSPP